MANVVWSLQGNAASIEKALQSTSSKYDEVAKKAKKAGEDSGKGSEAAARGLRDQAKNAGTADRAVAGLGKQVAGLAAGYLSLSTVMRAASATFQAEQAAMTRAAELHASALEKAASFGRGRAGGGGIALDDEFRRRVIDQPVSQDMVLPQSQRAALAGAMQDSFGDINLDQVVAGVEAASKLAGALSNSELELFARNLATLQKLPLGVDQAALESVALQATQRNVSLPQFSQAFERGAGMGLEGEDLQQMVALGIGAGASSERRAVVANMLNRVEEIMTPTERTVTVGGQVVGVTREGGFETASEAFRAVTEDPSMMNTQQRAALASSLASASTAAEVFGRDAFGALPQSATADAQRAALLSAARLEQSEGRRGSRARGQQQQREAVSAAAIDIGLPAVASSAAGSYTGAIQASGEISAALQQNLVTGTMLVATQDAQLRNIAGILQTIANQFSAPRTLSAGE